MWRSLYIYIVMDVNEFTLQGDFIELYGWLLAYMLTKISQKRVVYDTGTRFSPITGNIYCPRMHLIVYYPSTLLIIILYL